MLTSIRSPWPGASCVPVQETFLEEPALSGVMITSGFFHFSHVQREIPYGGSVAVSLVSVPSAKSDPMSPFVTIHWTGKPYPLDLGAIRWVSSFLLEVGVLLLCWLTTRLWMVERPLPYLTLGFVVFPLSCVVFPHSQGGPPKALGTLLSFWL